MRITDVSTDRQARGKLEITSHTVEDRTGETAVEIGIIESGAYDAVSTAVTETPCDVPGRAVSSEDKQVGRRGGTDVEQSETHAGEIIAEVDETELESPGIAVVDIDKPYLHAAERVGIVVDAALHAPHIPRSDVEATKLDTLPDTSGKVVQR